MKERIISSINLKTFEEDAWVILPRTPENKEKAVQCAYICDSFQHHRRCKRKIKGFKYCYQHR